MSFLHESNLIEGITTYVGDYYTGKSSNRHVMNSLKAAHYVLKNAKAKLTLPIILDIHRLQMNKLLPENYIGRLRDCPVRVGDDICPDAKSLERLLAKFINKYNIGKLSALELHYEFEGIHPFIDGNGRTGRLIYLMDKVRRGEPVRPILDEFQDNAGFIYRRAAYYAAIRQNKHSFPKALS